jgi:DNA repair protein RecO (recombination protein O)
LRAVSGASTETPAFILARTPYGEAHLVVQLFTLELGRVAALARSARKSQKRFGGALEPFHELSVRLLAKSGRELLELESASIRVPRLRLLHRLDAMDAAGRALSWVRRAAPPHTPELALYGLLRDLHERLDGDPPAPPRHALAETGFLLLEALGWGPSLEACVSCGKPCEPGRSALLDPRRGGIVCRSCGGARRIVRGPLRERLQSLRSGMRDVLSDEDEKVVLELVEDVLLVHAGLS